MQQPVKPHQQLCFPARKRLRSTTCLTPELSLWWEKLDRYWRQTNGKSDLQDIDAVGNWPWDLAVHFATKQLIFRRWIWDHELGTREGPFEISLGDLKDYHTAGKANSIAVHHGFTPAIRKSLAHVKCTMTCVHKVYWHVHLHVSLCMCVVHLSANVCTK